MVAERRFVVSLCWGRAGTRFVLVVGFPSDKSSSAAYFLSLWPNDRNSDLRALSSTKKKKKIPHPSTLSFQCFPHLTTIANHARIIQTHSTNIHNVQHVPPTHCGSATETTAGTEISYHLFPAGQTVLVATLLWNTGVHLQKNTCPKIAELSKYHRNQTFSVWGTTE